MLGLFDRPVDEKAIAALLKPPAINDLTEPLTDLSPTEWRALLARLRRARLVASEDPQNPGHLDTHPLVREYFGEQLQRERPEAWKECNRRLYEYYRTLAPLLPDSFREMEPLFLAVICACNVGLSTTHCTKCFFRVSNGATNPLPQMFSELEGRCSLLWPLFSNRDTGAH